MDLWSYRNLSTFFFSSTDRESPPEKTPFRQLKSALSIDGSRSSASYKVGTPAMKLHLYLVMSLA